MAYTTINKGSSYFDTSLWTGTGATQSITSLNFQPDWLWVKTRSTAANHRSQNSVTGVTKGMNPNQTSAEDTLTDCVTSFNSNGFTLGADSQGYVNTSSRTYVGWSWLASNTTVANTSGTISSTVSVNTTAGFSIVSYTGTAVNATIGHGLGVKPAMMIIKNRISGVESWQVYHQAYGTGTQYFLLNGTNAVLTASTVFNNTAPTSSVFSVGTAGGTNGSSQGMIAYCFSEIKGYSKFGSYVGTGSATATPFIYTGFKPALVITKPSSAADSWSLTDIPRDNAVGGGNGTGARLQANNSDAENTNSTWASIQKYSNGFSPQGTDNVTNASGTTYIYMAFAQNPFVTSGGIPVTAR